MTEPAPDLDAYFARLGYTGARAAEPGVLRALLAAHVQAVPFENLAVLLGRRIDLQPSAIADKLVTRRRGGYCFEHNSLFRDVLRALGFRVTPLLARVRWQVPAEVRTPLTHMVLRVDVDGRPWLVDAGFGSVGATAPLALDTEAEQVTSHDRRRLICRGSHIVHQVAFGTESDWRDVYEFTLEPPAPLDFELGNWYSCTHPRAHFLNNLVVTLVRPEGRVAIFNREFTVRDLAGRAKTRPIGSRDELLGLLADPFGLRFPPGTRFDAPNLDWPA